LIERARASDPFGYPSTNYAARWRVYVRSRLMRAVMSSWSFRGRRRACP